jgi:lipase maturation factor 1
MISGMEMLGRLVAQVDSWSQWLVGSADGRSTYAVTRWIFLRALGLVYLIAFASRWVQVKGLIGSQGILPADQSLQVLKGYLGSERYRLVPTLFWFGSSDLALQLACAAGVGCALLLVGNVAAIPALIVLWALYLSLAAVGRDFLAFQWDVLLLEAGLLAIFLAPARLWPGRADAAPVSTTVLLLLWWLLFRLTFQSGLTKLTWGDPIWRDLTALDYHFYTQPLPTWTAWFAHQLPSWLKRLAVLLMYVLEIGFPLLIFGPRGARLVACAGIVVLQVAILKTGNYTFFNLLTIILALLLVDDAAWAHLLPARFIQGFAGGGGSAAPAAGVLRMVLAALVLAISGIKFWQNLSPSRSVPGFAARFAGWAEPFRSVNSYGLFRVMTTSRSEIIVEGSDDGNTWRAYEFKYKPGDVMRRPGFVEPHQPRLDWQMWFAALSTYEATPWFQGLLVRLLEGSPDVLELLARNPFPAHPPNYIRAMRYDYRFTTAAERRATGAWWSRTLVGVYSPVMSLAR